MALCAGANDKMDARSANQSLCTLTKAGRSPVAFHKPGDFTRLVPFRHFDSCKGTLSTRWHPGGPSAILSPAHRICTAYHLNLHYPAMPCYVPVFIHLTAQERKDQNSIGFVPPVYLWETIETDSYDQTTEKSVQSDNCPLPKIEI